MRQNKLKLKLLVPNIPSASAMAPSKRQHPGTMTMTVDTDYLDCGICNHPLKPPIFQCKNGHMLCSPCRDKLAPAGKCHMCGITTRGYDRCNLMEKLMENSFVKCPNTAHGCGIELVYYDLAGHLQVCPYAPCHCPSESCSFVGTTKQLVDHITAGSHGWPCTTKVIMARETCIRLQDGFNFLVLDHLVDKQGAGAIITSITGKFLFLLNVARQPHGQHFLFNISVLCIDPHHIYNGQGQISKAIKCALTYGWSSDNFLCHNSLHSEIKVDCTDLSDGLSSQEMCFKFLVPNSVLEDRNNQEAIDVDVSITIC